MKSFVLLGVLFSFLLLTTSSGYGDSYLDEDVFYSDDEYELNPDNEEYEGQYPPPFPPESTPPHPPPTPPRPPLRPPPRTPQPAPGTPYPNNACKPPKNLKHSMINCKEELTVIKCEQTCKSGFKIANKDKRTQTCWYLENKWTPDPKFEDCKSSGEAVFSNPC